MITVGIVVLVVLAVIGWFQLRERIADQGVEAAETCVEGRLVVSVVVDPDISSEVSRLATEFTATGPVVRDHCVSIEVAVHTSDEIADSLAAGDDSWNESQLGPLPALWIPRSSDSVGSLPANTVNGTPRSVAYTPVVLATPDAVANSLSAANIGWADIPRLQSSTAGLDSTGLPGWGGLRLRLPVGPEADDTSAALGAIVSATLDDSSEPLSPEIVRSDPAARTLSALSITDRTAPSAAIDSTDSALAQLSADTSQASEVHAVPITARQLGASAQEGLTAYSPAGLGPVADYPAVILSGESTDETSSRAAAQFVEFLRRPDNSQLFVDAGFDVGDPPAAAPSVDADTRQALIDAVLDPATPRRVTTLLDISGSMDTAEGQGTRLQNTVAALNRQFDSIVGFSDVGLWAFSKDLDGPRAYRVLVPTGPIDENLGSGSRREQLVSAASELQPATATSTYASVSAALIGAQNQYSAEKSNRLVLVTDGPNDDTSISAEQFLTTLTETVDPNRPVAIDVVSIGTNSDASTLQSMSDITGGSYTSVSSSSGDELPDLLRKLLY